MKKNYYVTGKIDNIKLSDDESLPRLRVSDLMDFFVAVGRSGKCPHCPHDGVWEVSMHKVSDEADPENPLLSLYLSPTSAGDTHTSAGVTCPNCGHFALINTYKIRQFQEREGSHHG
ncbi:hypothetical protein [Pseudomonas aylmerensis]|uniref:hypothetical protein n=1 Tax=Pseudomonas aylmerensis TaxID=1869229 RepID=UPI00114CA768|nr:hypothetical protein [Pseudomonas aylmerensis]